MGKLIIAFATLLIAAAGSAAEVTFLSPLEGSQVIGPTAIEITTSVADVDRVEFLVDGVLVGVARRPPYRIAFDFGSELQSRQIVAKVLSSGYSRTDRAVVTTAALTAGESMAVDLVEVPLRVRSTKTLRPADLKLRENSVEQTIREITPARGAAHFAFVVDRSLSMDDGRLEAALRAVDEALAMLRAGDSASLVLFNHNVGKPRPVTRSSPAAAAIGETTPSGGTSLRDAISSIPARQRTYAIVLTDGGDRNSAISEEAALRKVSSTRTIVAAVVFGEPSRFLQQAARNTGGVVKSATRSSAARVLRNIIADLNSRYMVVYQSRGTARGWRSIDIAGRRGGIEILSARKGYFAE